MEKKVKIKPYKNITIEFDKEKHRFSMDGRPIISVTSITSIVDKSSALISWAVRLYREFLEAAISRGEVISPKHILEGSKQHTIVKERAADIGSQIHEFANLWITSKKKPKIPDDEKVKNGILAFLKWIDENKIKFLKSEEIVYSKKHNYAGILDAEAKVNGELAIIDFKSSKGIYNEMRYQVAGYRGAKEEMTKKKYKVSWIIQFGKDTGEFKAVRIDDHKKDFKAFLAALTIKRREMELRNYGRDH